MIMLSPINIKNLWKEGQDKIVDACPGLLSLGSFPKPTGEEKELQSHASNPSNNCVWSSNFSSISC